MTEQATIDNPTTEPTEAPEQTPATPRDDKGRFTKADDAQDEGYRPGEDPEAMPDEPEPESDEQPDKGEDDEQPTGESAGLDLESEDAPVYDHEGKFVGGKFLGKYETLDDALGGHKSALREMTRLQKEVQELQQSGIPDDGSAVSIKAADDVSDDELSDLLMKEMGLGEDGELSLDDRIAIEENQAKWLAKNMTKAMRIYNRVNAERQGRRAAWAKSVQSKYTSPVVEGDPNSGYGWTQKTFDDAVAESAPIWPLVIGGKMSQRELRALLGIGLMYRARKLTLANPAVKKQPGGRSPEVEGSRPTPKPKKSTEREEDRALREMQQAAYG